jgi:dTDP-4-amino-4,6-dideoxygalactose transaminase
VPVHALASPGRGRADRRRAIRRVIDRGWFVLGPEVEAFEAEFAAACGARTPSAWAPAPTPSRSSCARSASGPATR